MPASPPPERWYRGVPAAKSFSWTIRLRATRPSRSRMEPMVVLRATLDSLITRTRQPLNSRLSAATLRSLVIRAPIVALLSSRGRGLRRTWGPGFLRLWWHRWQRSIYYQRRQHFWRGRRGCYISRQLYRKSHCRQCHSDCQRRDKRRRRRKDQLFFR